jgi:hypothetical protein
MLLSEAVLFFSQAMLFIYRSRGTPYTDAELKVSQSCHPIVPLALCFDLVPPSIILFHIVPIFIVFYVDHVLLTKYLSHP